jgi:hypothetical protein
VLPFITPRRLPTFPEAPCGSQVFPGGRGCHEAFRGAYTAGEWALLLRRPIVSGCVQGTARPNNLRIRLAVQTRPGSCIGGCSSAQGGGETDGLPRLVDVSCEVGDGPCWDILCLVRWVSIRHAVGPSGVINRLGTNKRSSMCCAAGGDRSYPVAGRQAVMNTVHVV